MLERLQKASQRAGFTCLATEWKNASGGYVLQCARGHQIIRAGTNILRHSVACPQCRNQDRLELLHKIAHSKGGKCLETTYLGYVHHRFECAKGHEWKVNPSDVINNGRWCRRCAQIKHGQRILRKDGLTELQRVAAEKGGRCICDTYKGAKERYRFECAQEHQWEAAASHILAGGWCRACAAKQRGANGRANGYQRLQQVLKEKGGICLDDYAGSRLRYRFRCGSGHEWHARSTEIIAGQWCSECAKDENRKQQTNELRVIARERGGQLLSDYVDSKTKLHYVCHLGHHWNTLSHNIRKGNWCPKCRDIANVQKQKHRYENGSPLAAFVTERRNQAVERKKTKERKKPTADDMQRRLYAAVQQSGLECLSPWRGRLQTHVLQCASGHQFTRVGASILSREVKCPTCFGQRQLERMQLTAQQKGGSCLEGSYLGNALHRFVCANGHEWKARPTHIVRDGSWCRLCFFAAHTQYMKIQDGLAQLQRIATENGGRCLSDTYLGTAKHHRFQCAYNHQWETTAATVLGGGWCTQCNLNARKLTIAMMRQMAQERGGACLSEQYVNNATKLLWECHRGHRWHAAPSAIRNGGHWCPECAHLDKICSPKSNKRFKYQASLQHTGQSG